MLKYNLCRICNSKLKDKLLTFKNYPVSLWPSSKQLRSKKKDLEVYSCKKCKLIQLQRFNLREMSSFYKGGQYIVHDKNLLINRYKKIINFIPEKKIKGKKILEIGGGRNTLLNFFPKSEKWLVDFSIIKKKLNNINIIKKNFEYTNIKKNYFDYIIFFHTLEHIEDPKKFILKINSLLKKDGRIILEVPNLNFYLAQKPYHAFFFQHVSIFSPQTLDNLLTFCGFEPVKKIIEKKIILNFYKKINNNKIKFKGKPQSLRLKKVFENNLIKNNLILTKIKKTHGVIGFYGVGGTALTLIAHLKNHLNKINFFYDSDPNKYQKYIPMTNLKVRSFKNLLSDKPDTLIFNSRELMNIIKKKYKCKKYILLE